MTAGALGPDAFHAAEGTDDWRVVFGGACTVVRTPSFAAGAAFVADVADLARDLSHDPDVDLRPTSVTIRLASEPLGSLTDLDLALARRVSAAIRAHGLTADPTAVQAVQIALDALVAPEVMPFWRAVLGYDQVGEEDVVDPLRRGPAVWFQDMDAPRPQRNRIHVDVCVAPEQGEARVAAAVAAGGRVVRDRGPQYWTLADAEGNEVDVATMLGRG